MSNKNFILILIISIFIIGCTNHFPLKEDITSTQNEFLNQDSILVKFPEVIQNKISLVAMVYTNCPDICPLTTHNMILIEKKLSNNDLEKIRFVVISFDPVRDTPSILKSYARVRELNLNHWILLTGDKENTTEVMKKFNVKAIPVDSTYDERGNLNYSIIHTDRMSLVDQNGKIRKHYSGSTANIDEIVNDMKILLN